MTRLFAALLGMVCFVSTAAFSLPNDYIRCEQPLTNGHTLVGELLYKHTDSQTTFKVLLQELDLTPGPDADDTVDSNSGFHPTPPKPFYEFTNTYQAKVSGQTSKVVQFIGGEFDLVDGGTLILPEFADPIHFKNCHWPEAGVTVHN